MAGMRLYGCSLSSPGESKESVPRLSESRGAVMRNAVVGLMGVLGIDVFLVLREEVERGRRASEKRSDVAVTEWSSGSKAPGRHWGEMVLYRFMVFAWLIDTFSRRSASIESAGAEARLRRDVVYRGGQTAESGNAGVVAGCAEVCAVDGEASQTSNDGKLLVGVVRLLLVGLVGMIVIWLADLAFRSGGGICLGALSSR